MAIPTIKKPVNAYVSTPESDVQNSVVTFQSVDYYGIGLWGKEFFPWTPTHHFYVPMFIAQSKRYGSCHHIPDFVSSYSHVAFNKKAFHQKYKKNHLIILTC